MLYVSYISRKLGVKKIPLIPFIGELFEENPGTYWNAFSFTKQVSQPKVEWTVGDYFSPKTSEVESDSRIVSAATQLQTLEEAALKFNWPSSFSQCNYHSTKYGIFSAVLKFKKKEGNIFAYFFPLFLSGKKFSDILPLEMSKSNAY